MKIDPLNFNGQSDEKIGLDNHDCFKITYTDWRTCKIRLSENLTELMCFQN